MNSYITAIGTANPKYKLTQTDVARFMNRTHKRINGSEVRLEALYRASGIKYRYTVLKDYTLNVPDYSFFPRNDQLDPFPGTASRMEIYQREAKKLALSAVEDCFGERRVDKKSITHLITVSCTGFYAPGLDIDLIHELELPTDISRTAINYMGCYAAISAIRIGDSIIAADPKAKVLIACVELCSLHFQKEDNEDNLLANALFGDGAAAVLMEKTSTDSSFGIGNFASEILKEGASDMAWKVGDLGFEMKLSRYVPSIIEGGLNKLTDKLVQNFNNIGSIADIEHFAIHPGGKKILAAVENALHIPKEKNQHAYNVLKNYGNMSSPTILFVLKEIMKNLVPTDQSEKVFCMAFGPGLTLESMMLSTPSNA